MAGCKVRDLLLSMKISRFGLSSVGVGLGVFHGGCMSVSWAVMEWIDEFWMSERIEVLLTWGNPIFGSSGKAASVRCRWLISRGAVQAIPCIDWYAALLGVSSTERLVAAVFGLFCLMFRSIKSIAVTVCLF